MRIDGSVARDERQDIVDKFQQDSRIPVFLLTTQVCLGCISIALSLRAHVLHSW